jgi:hypothetical protein
MEPEPIIPYFAPEIIRDGKRNALRPHAAARGRGFERAESRLFFSRMAKVAGTALPTPFFRGFRQYERLGQAQMRPFAPGSSNFCHPCFFETPRCSSPRGCHGLVLGTPTRAGWSGRPGHGLDDQPVAPDPLSSGLSDQDLCQSSWRSRGISIFRQASRSLKGPSSPRGSAGTSISGSARGLSDQSLF